MSQMDVVTLVEPGRFVAGQGPAPGALSQSPRRGHALVRVRRIGVCGTDLHAFQGNQPFFSYPRVLGHELGVEVEAVGVGVTGAAAGDRCAVEPYLNCGDCLACRCGRTNCCEHLAVLGVHVDGGMCQWLELPAEKLHRSDSLTLEQLALVETLCIGAHAAARAAELGELRQRHVAVVGAGPIGLAVMQMALLRGATVTALDVNHDRLQFAETLLGVGTVWVDAKVGGAETARALASHGGGPATVVFDATGHAGSMRRSFDYLPATGVLVLVGLTLGNVAFDDPSFHRRELTVMATRNATAAEFREVIQHMEAERIDTAPWITHPARLIETPEVFAGWVSPSSGVIKAMVTVD